MACVIDSSVCSGWFRASQATEYSAAIAVRLQPKTALAPMIRELALTKVPRTACLRQRLSALQAQEIVAAVAELPIEVDRAPVQRGELLALALRFSLSGCDAAYLEPALRRRIPIATRYEVLAAAALASGVGWVPANEIT
jgi:predicted nucleic acid-binding protein